MQVPKTFRAFIQKVYKSDFSINNKYLATFKKNQKPQWAVYSIEIDDVAKIENIYNNMEGSLKENIYAFCSYQEVQDEKSYPVALYIVSYISPTEGFQYRISLSLLDIYYEKMMDGSLPRSATVEDDPPPISRFDIIDF